MAIPAPSGLRSGAVWPCGRVSEAPRACACAVSCAAGPCPDDPLEAPGPTCTPSGTDPLAPSLPEAAGALSAGAPVIAAASPDAVAGETPDRARDPSPRPAGLAPAETITGSLRASGPASCGENASSFAVAVMSGATDARVASSASGVFERTPLTGRSGGLSVRGFRPRSPLSSSSPASGREAPGPGSAGGAFSVRLCACDGSTEPPPLPDWPGSGVSAPVFCNVKMRLRKSPVSPLRDEAGEEDRASSAGRVPGPESASSAFSVRLSTCDGSIEGRASPLRDGRGSGVSVPCFPSVERRLRKCPVSALRGEAGEEDRASSAGRVPGPVMMDA
mgnify:FL=1